jgi:adenosylcobinamide-GDP ribazoletransferase
MDVQAFVEAVGRALRFYSRLPVPPILAGADAGLGFAAMAPAIPVAGAVIGLVAALAFALACALGLDILVASLVAVGCGVAVTGALHEDGLADMADAVFARVGAERRLEIMRDSRLGTFGVLALILAVGLRVTLVAQLALPFTSSACAALIAAGALSRGAGLMPLNLLAPARSDGAGAAAGRLPMRSFVRAALLACAIGFVVLLLGRFGIARAVYGCVAPFAASYGVTVLAREKIGGQTGDVAGAAQLAAELAVYLVLALGFAGHPA